jgi:pilus assembly protein CpaE
MAINLIIASPETHFRDFVREQLAHTPNAKVVSEHEEVGLNLYVRVLHDLDRYPQASVLLDISGDVEQGLRALEHLSQAAPGLYIILSDLQAGSEALIRAMRSGAADFLMQPLKRAEFRDTMARLEQHMQRVHSQTRQLGKMYSFVGVKGGVGTTTAAINFAALAAKQKKNTLLLDLDLGSGDVASYLGLQPQYSLAEATENLQRLDHAMLDGIITQDALGFHVLCAPDDIEKARLISPNQLKELTTFLIEKYDLVIVDGSRGLGDFVLGALELSDSIFLMMTQEFPAVRNVQHYVNSLVRMGSSQETLKLVVNRYQKRAPMYVSMEQLQQTLNLRPFWALPNRYEEAMAAVHKARPIVLNPASELGKSYQEFAKKVTAENHSTAPAAAAASR